MRLAKSLRSSETVRCYSTFIRHTAGAVLLSGHVGTTSRYSVNKVNKMNVLHLEKPKLTSSTCLFFHLDWFFAPPVGSLLSKRRTLALETSDEILQKTMMEAHMRTEISNGDVDVQGSSFRTVPPEFKTMMWSIAGHFRSLVDIGRPSRAFTCHPCIVSRAL